MILGVLNQKGGVGKTTVCLNLAAFYARAGMRVLVVDSDPQASALAWSNAREAPPLFPVIGMVTPLLHRKLPDIRLRANNVLERRIAHLLRRRPGRPSNQVERHYANFTYQAKSWSKPRRVVAKVEWHPGELFPRVGFVVTTLTVSAERVFEFYNRRGTAEQYIKEGKHALKWTRLPVRGSSS